MKKYFTKLDHDTPYIVTWTAEMQAGYIIFLSSSTDRYVDICSSFTPTESHFNAPSFRFLDFTVKLFTNKLIW